MRQCFKPLLSSSEYIEHCEVHTKAGLFHSKFFHVTIGRRLCFCGLFFRSGTRRRGNRSLNVHVVSGSYSNKRLRQKERMTGISRLKSFVLDSFQFNMTRPPGGTVSPIHLYTTGLLTTNQQSSHITEKCVTCK